jgi:protein SCO1/2
MTTRNRNRPLYRIVLLAVALLALVGGYWLGNHYQRPSLEGISATLLPEPRPIGGFSLRDDNGKPFGPQQLRGHWTFVFFGYTHCPDICPDTLYRMVQVFNRLAVDPDLQKDTRMVFVSVDPQRDTPEVLHDYVRYFHPDFTGVTGPEEELLPFARQFSVVYMKQAPAEGSDNYLVDHSAAILLVDPDGQLHGIFSGVQDPGTIAADLQKIAGNWR